MEGSNTMRMGIMQPYFFPYIGYISLIKHTDEFMLFDPVQFIHHGWIERNRILKPFDKNKKTVPGENWQYVSVPLIKHSRETLIKDVKINNEIDWRNKLINQLCCYKKRAPYYEDVMKVIKKGIDIQTDSIVELNRNILQEICYYLGIDTKITVFSEENLTIKTPNAPDEWALNICLAKGNMNEYWNPPGGMNFFDGTKYEKAGINLKFQQVKLEPYIQRIGYFEAGLSIIDVMMFNNVEEINKMLDNYELVELKTVKKYERKKN